jgi:hypothetical protein
MFDKLGVICSVIAFGCFVAIAGINTCSTNQCEATCHPQALVDNGHKFCVCAGSDDKPVLKEMK